MPFIFQNLHVYQKAVDLAELVSNLTDKFPRGCFYLSDQFNRAALSISLNIAEGNGRMHKKDRMNFFIISRGSVHECVPITEVLKRKNLITEEEAKDIDSRLEEISKMLSGLIKGLDAR